MGRMVCEGGRGREVVCLRVVKMREEREREWPEKGYAQQIDGVQQRLRVRSRDKGFQYGMEGAVGVAATPLYTTRGLVLGGTLAGEAVFDTIVLLQLLQ